MNLKFISMKYKIDKADFMQFVYRNNLQFSETHSDYSIADENVQNYVNMYKDYVNNLNEQYEMIQREKELIKRKAMSEMLITSGFSFDGYKIIKYSGYISGDDAVSVDRGMAIFGSGTNVKDKLMESLVIIRRNALAELKEAAYALGCNAVIGVDFDYLTLDPQTANIGGGTTYQPYIFGVTANGNAVIIEKIDE